VEEDAGFKSDDHPYEGLAKSGYKPDMTCTNI
jgi:hypothetical protein